MGREWELTQNGQLACALQCESLEGQAHSWHMDEALSHTEICP